MTKLVFGPLKTKQLQALAKPELMVILNDLNDLNVVKMRDSARRAE
jgi:hypothetical protein